jgi:hypothetical protein
VDQNDDALYRADCTPILLLSYMKGGGNGSGRDRASVNIARRHAAP